MQIHSDAQACPTQLFCDFLAAILLLETKTEHL